MTEDISVLIIEDESIWSDSISLNLIDFGYAVAGVANTFENAAIALGNLEYDVILLDINLNTRNSGIELGKLIHQLYKKPYIFVSSVSEKALLKEAVAAGPSAFLSKPVSPASLIATIQTAINNFNSQVVAQQKEGDDCPFFFVKSGNKYKKITWKEVAYLRSEKKYTCIYNTMDKTEHYIKSTLINTLRYIVPSNLRDMFVQVNRSEVVNLQYITEYAADEVKTGFKTFTVSDSFVANLRKELRLTL